MEQNNGATRGRDCRPIAVEQFDAVAGAKGPFGGVPSGLNRKLAGGADRLLQRRRLGKPATHPIGDGEDRQRGQDRHQPGEPAGQRAAERDPQSEQAEDDGTVALAQRAVVMPGDADHRPERAGELGGD
jgi:hypothetical protein